VGYHGTHDIFDVLEVKPHPVSLSGELVDWSSEQPVIFFSSSPRSAPACDNQIVRACLSLDNPLVIDAGGKRWSDVLPLDHVSEAVLGGHDSIVVHNISDVASGKPILTGSTIIVVFDTNQILRLAPGAPVMSAQELEAFDCDLLDCVAFGVVSDEVVTLTADRLQVRYPGDLDCAEHDLRANGPCPVETVDLSEPIDVSVDESGCFLIEDGHHRYVAARARGCSLMAKIEIKGNPVRAILARQDRWRRRIEATQDCAPCV